MCKEIPPPDVTHADTHTLMKSDPDPSHRIGNQATHTLPASSDQSYSAHMPVPVLLLTFTRVNDMLDAVKILPLEITAMIPPPPLTGLFKYPLTMAFPELVTLARVICTAAMGDTPSPTCTNIPPPSSVGPPNATFLFKTTPRTELFTATKKKFQEPHNAHQSHVVMTANKVLTT
jgi:hypothetical protein